MSNNTQPEIRFPGFTEDWEQRKAKELFIPKAEKNQPELPVLSVTQDHGVVYREQVGIDIKYDKATLKNYKVIHQGDFVISLRSFQGGFELSDKLGITSPAYTIFVPKNMDSQDNLFWKTKFKTFTFIESLKTVTFGIRDGKSISFSEFGDLKLFFPKNIEEQQKIGAFFKQLDDTIALHQRKLDLLKETKKGFLQKMFPKNGAKVPEIRFPGFTEDWEERKLGDITKISTGKLDANAMVENGKYDFYTSGIKKYRIDVAAFEGPSITIAGNGATVGYMHLADNKFNAYQRTYVLQEFLVDRSFIFSEIGNKLPKKIKQEARTGNIPYIVMDMLTELKLSIPQNNSEQQKIGTFFKQLDDTITLHQRKLDLLKETKKGFLQKMFV
ncbi:restriction endonuclease subunit S [Enterococcus faecium]|uniref:restriction endonuclease subunit S n=1 Tax=Enterococcus faecium TaxID=1352 RepID=UPI0017865732|nr:restriction endonuclease subunit S [Enterococcus faecium]MBD9741183.1 restriction endonuclease subunit S [Enterococcus faecium]MBD9743891.1 restriction endonuclease subunit S [Enterococcus faecium]MBD9755904.1 restriction endonuclease subunit S [Enterococcus faecium]MBD9800898.1 restriction endonuclease subunit S [Enterococcus faecium]MBD9806270.1 restriction endonuclease subunit S [Enterococcus faecium]